MRPGESMNDAGYEAFDATLRAALIDRPEPYPASNLAARVIDQARLAAKTNPAPATRRVAWLERMTSFIAAAALAVVVVFGVQRINKLQSTTASDDAATSTSSTSTQDVEAILLIGGAALAATFIYLAVQGSTTLDEGRLDLTADSRA